jgi:hypothetical protein
MNERRVEEMENKIGNLKSNPFSPKGKEHKMTPKQQGTRTQIKDLPEIAIELPEKELRIVSGGLRSIGAISCYSSVAMVIGDRTQYVTGGDWDSD